MLAVFENTIGKPPEELNLPSKMLEASKTREQIAESFRSSWPDSSFYNLAKGRNFMALSHQDESLFHPRSDVVMDDIFCMFVGNIENVCELRHYYGVCKQTTEAMLVIEVYKVLRDRAPYPCDQVIKDINGKFAFILFDAKYSTLFTARDRDGSVPFHWGMAADRSLVLSDDHRTVAEACGRSCAAFPPGCIFMNASGLVSFVHPLNKVKAVAHEDDDGRISAVIFKVDLYTRIPSIPRTGSSANWADAAMVGE